MTATEVLKKLAEMDPRDLLVRLVWGEARGEAPVGQLAVLHVVMNRMKYPERSWYGASKGIKGVCLQPWQFSCFNKNDPNLALLLTPPRYSPLIVVETVVDLALSNATTDPTFGCTHYFNPQVVPGGWPASWDKSKMEFKVKIGRHVFYEEVL